MTDFYQHIFTLMLPAVEINNIVTDAMKFISGLEFTLRKGLSQGKLVALRRCIERIWINKSAGEIKLAIRTGVRFR